MAQPQRVLESAKRKPRSTLPTDEWVGSKIKMRRNTVRMSQTELGEAIGVTFQQIQKYEKGINRVGAGRLQQIARVLGIPVAWFFEGAPKLAKTGDEPTNRMSAFAAFMRSRYAPEIVSSFVQLPDSLQKSLTLLISQVAAKG
jgi:transcriptional regulator with XRE-family HTH domain